MESPTQKSQQFYEHYFDSADYDVFRYDVGSFCTRQFIIKNIKNCEGRVLEIGVGISTILEDLAQFDRYGIDVSSKNIELAASIFSDKKMTAKLQVANAEELPFESNFFDVIVSSHTLEHVKNDTAVLRECSRVLKSGGEALFFVPGRVSGIATQEEWEKLGHYRMYNSARFMSLEKSVLPHMRLTHLIYPHKIHNLVWNKTKKLFRWVNYPVKKWILRDHKTYELRPIYQKLFMPAMAKTLNYLDAKVMNFEDNFLGKEFNVLARFEKN